MPDHVLMTVLGTGHKLTKYRLDEDDYCASLAPTALFHLLRKANRQPDRILAFCTEKAQETYRILEQDLQSFCATELVPIPEGETADTIGDFLRIFADAAPQQGELTVETTHGFRHYAMAMLLGAFYVSALRDDVQLRHVYYALFSEGSSPIIDLKRLLELSHWIHAANTFRTTGSAQPIAQLIREADSGQNADRMARELIQLSRCLADGLPLELGLQARAFVAERIRPLQNLVNRKHLPRPLGYELTGRIRAELHYYALSADGKATAELDGSELARQAQLIDRMYQYGHRAAAVGLMREWVVSWAMYNDQTGHSHWLDERRPAERALNLLVELRNEDRGDLLSARQRELAEFWDNLRDLRNLVAHHGMKREDTFSKKTKSLEEKVWKFWQKRMKSLPGFSLDVADGMQHDRLIVSPLGHTPGVLFSTLRTCDPPTTARDLCLVITSREAAAHMDEALDKAQFTGQRQALVFNDPFAGLDERPALRQEAAQFILRARETHVNVTGGTTLMGLLADEIAHEARNYQRLATRFVLVDQRSPEDQRAQPYVVGTRIEIESVQDGVSE